VLVSRASVAADAGLYHGLRRADGRGRRGHRCCGRLALRRDC